MLRLVTGAALVLALAACREEQMGGRSVDAGGPHTAAPQTTAGPTDAGAPADADGGMGASPTTATPGTRPDAGVR